MKSGGGGRGLRKRGGGGWEGGGGGAGGGPGGGGGGGGLWVLSGLGKDRGKRGGGEEWSERSAERGARSGCEISQPGDGRGTLRGVAFREQRTNGRRCVALLLLGSAAVCAVVCCSGSAWAQSAGTAALPAAPQPNQATLLTVLAGGVRVERATGAPMPLSLDDAIARSLLHNVQVEEAQQSEQVVRGQVLTEENSLLPNLSAQISSSAEEMNLAAMGFKPASLGPLLAGFGLTTFATIVKVDVTSAELQLSQPLFNLPAFFLYRSASRARAGANLQTLNVRGGLVLEVGGQYLRVLADAAQIENARALERSDARALQQAVDAHRAGTATNLGDAADAGAAGDLGGEHVRER